MSEKATDCTIPTIRCSGKKRQNNGFSKKVQWLPEFRDEGVKKRPSTEEFQGSEIMLQDTVMMDRCHEIFVQTQNVRCQQ